MLYPVPVAESEPARPLAPKLHALVVDDETVNRSLLRRMLQRLGCSVVERSDGDEVQDCLLGSGQVRLTESGQLLAAVVDDHTHALVSSDSGTGLAAAGRRFDAIFLDIQMRRMNGDVLCRQLRDAGLTVPIIATTGSAVVVFVDCLVCHAVSSFLFAVLAAFIGEEHCFVQATARHRRSTRTSRCLGSALSCRSRSAWLTFVMCWTNPWLHETHRCGL